jgi:polar amino acid transport system substrate-binding protein
MLAEGSYVDETTKGSGGTLISDGPAIPIGDGAGVVLRKADDALELKVNTALEAMRADGSIDALIAKWFPEMGPPPYFAD